MKVRLTKKVSSYRIDVATEYKPGDVFEVDPERFRSDFMEKVEVADAVAQVLPSSPTSLGKAEANVEQDENKDENPTYIEEETVEEKPAKKTRKKKAVKTVVEEAEPESDLHSEAECTGASENF
jgi:hypothetical protein